MLFFLCRLCPNSIWIQPGLNPTLAFANLLWPPFKSYSSDEETVKSSGNNSLLGWSVAGGGSSERWEPETEWEDECSSSTDDSGLSDTGAKEIWVSRSRKGEKESLAGSMSWSWLMISLMDSFMLSSSFAFCRLVAWSPEVLIVTEPERSRKRSRWKSGQDQFKTSDCGKRQEGENHLNSPKCQKSLINTHVWKNIPEKTQWFIFIFP